MGILKKEGNGCLSKKEKRKGRPVTKRSPRAFSPRKKGLGQQRF